MGSSLQTRSRFADVMPETEAVRYTLHELVSSSYEEVCELGLGLGNVGSCKGGTCELTACQASDLLIPCPPLQKVTGDKAGWVAGSSQKNGLQRRLGRHGAHKQRTRRSAGCSSLVVSRTANAARICDDLRGNVHQVTNARAFFRFGRQRNLFGQETLLERVKPNQRWPGANGNGVDMASIPTRRGFSTSARWSTAQKVTRRPTVRNPRRYMLTRHTAAK